MLAFCRIFERLSYFMYLTSGCFLVLMMFVTLADVTARAMFEATTGSVDFTFIGGIELIKYGLLFVVLFAFPHSVGRSQVIVDLFTENLSSRIKLFLEGFYLLGYVLLGGGMSYRFYHALEQARTSGETTQDLLIPLYYLYGIASFATATLAVAALLICMRCFFYSEGDQVV